MDSHQEAAASDPTWARLEDQLRWYDTKSQSCQRVFKRTKLLQLVIGAAVPVLALIEVHAGITASFAAVVVVLEGSQQLYQWQSNWILYRSTAEALKHEKFLFIAGAGPYGGDNRGVVLAERTEGLVSQEHAKWTEAGQAQPEH